MELTVKKQIGKSVLEVSIEEKSDKDAIAKALIFTQPDVCGLCKSPNVIWESNKATTKDGGTYTYIKRRCLSCNATSTLGEYKAGGYFWKKWEIYIPDQTAEGDSAKGWEEQNGHVEDKAPF